MCQYQTPKGRDKVPVFDTLGVRPDCNYKHRPTLRKEMYGAVQYLDFSVSVHDDKDYDPNMTSILFL